MLRQGSTVLQHLLAAHSGLNLTAQRAFVSGFSNSETLRHASSASVSHAERPVDRFNLQIILKSFELRYITEASTVIRDLILLNYAPKSGDLVRLSHGSPSEAANLFFPINDAKIPTKITKYTLLRSPHVNKTAREQFERRVHKRCIMAPTTSYHELQWLIDSITSYEFSGVQIQLNISNNTYLQPAKTETRFGSVLSQHMQHQAEQFRLGELRHSVPARTDDEILDKLDAATASISDPHVRTKVRSLVVAINEVLLKLRLPNKIDEAAMAKAISGLVRPDQPIDWVKVLNVVKYGQLLQKIAEMQDSGEGVQAADEQLAGIYQAVATALVAAGKH